MFNKRKVLRLVMAVGLVLGIHKGYLALWQTGNTIPHTVYPLKISLLPPAEQVRLKSGISIQDSDHLKALLQDYLS